MPQQFKIVIAGTGGIGSALGLLLREYADFKADLFMGDQALDAAERSVKWIREGSSKDSTVEAFLLSPSETTEEMKNILEQSDILLDCLPGGQAPRMAALAKQYKLHYANLTEYVKETEEIVEIARDAEKGFVLQTGLAPGFINVLANKLFRDFCKKNSVEKVDSIAMKVGALTRHAIAPHYYGVTWSSIGVATEYIKDSIVVRKGQKTLAPSLSERSLIKIDGITYEEAITSGGAADLPVALAGKVNSIDYKTLRYPGHYEWVQNLINKFPEDSEKKIKLLEAELTNNIPHVEDDIVVIYASVQGKDNKNILRLDEQSYFVEPVKVGHKSLRAIQATTASALAEVARMLLLGNYKGAVFQSQLDPDYFLNGRFVKQVYK
jgi:saccharopine dehydrogenase-like NADP-dependent oxidoreductase